MLVALEQREAIDVEDRRERVLEPALFPGGWGAFLRLARALVDVVAREAVFRCDEVGRDALRHEISWNRERRISRPCASRCADADAAHRFDAPSDREVVLSAHYLSGGEIDRVEARRAESVDLNARDRVAEACCERAHARDVAAGFANRIDTTHHHVVDINGFKMVAILDRL